MESRIGASVQVEPFTITRRKVPEVADPGHATNMTPSVDWKRFCERKDFNFYTSLIARSAQPPARDDATMNLCDTTL